MPAFAANTTGQGTGVSSQPPGSLTSEPDISQPSGVKPPSPSNETVKLGTYEGTVNWASGMLYSHKWVRTSGTTIKLDGCFGIYKTKEDAINRKNPLSNLRAPISIWLVDSSGKSTSAKTIYTNDGWKTISFTVTANEDYYVAFDFNTGYYESGDFKVYK
ncbi:hypothetical protein [Desulfoscipio gibsoniae]|uniref:hypothetical protein n=1 Tax=Desulfoscipio gibsoniae TaxID=102134 RepID=UPI0012FF5975|nr:hypothetical protein [Desulfoscipio gibsoniae]